MTAGDELVGARVLVGITYRDGEGGVVERHEVHGVVVTVGETIGLEQPDGDVFSIPPGGLTPAVPGAVYRLRSTGEALADIDFVATFDVRPGEGD